MIPKFNENLEITINNNIVKVETNTKDYGFDFEIELEKLTDYTAYFKINYVYNKTKNIKMKNGKLTKKYSRWIVSILNECRNERLL